ncbi:hypothetical protein E3E12_06125 [Formicincola oecophyllae]|uniref:Uncharacterized protein n=1 Tax=Formicincola oecophyllae TaxID=2558361 RepID=A0A4Y6UBQ0_9PROT|nr:hypothetical protein [Formicincola oecophyllae]QDH13831.1 hypothetical protein E3E12_06125 [Formicincola oecophyllae]
MTGPLRVVPCDVCLMEGVLDDGQICPACLGMEHLLAPQQVDCPACEGWGVTDDGLACTACRGRGSVSQLP